MLRVQVSDCAKAATPSQRRRWLVLFMSGWLVTTFVVMFMLVGPVSWSSSISIAFHRPDLESEHHHYHHQSHNMADSDAESDQDTLIELNPNDHVFRASKTLSFTWNITKGERAPDGVVKQVYLINDQFPGPLIEARSGDELIVNVLNSLEDEGASIHWHGLKMKDANDMDGAVGLTQCSIAPGRNMTYQFHLDDDQSGTFWYHAHSGIQRADGLSGGLVIHKPVKGQSDLSTYDYQHERLLMVGDWYHRQGADVMEWFMDPSHYAYEPAPDSLLLNGRGSYNCSKAVPARPVNCSAVAKPEIHLGNIGRFRLRVVNTGITSGFALSLSKSNMKVITLDGGNGLSNETPAAHSVGVLYSGERFDAIVDHGARSNNDEEGEQLTVTLDKENMGLINFALTSEQSFKLNWPGKVTSLRAQSANRVDVLSEFNLFQAQGASIATTNALPDEPQETAVLYSAMSIRAANNNRPVGTVNHTSWMMTKPDSPPLLALERSQWDDAVKQPTSVQKLMVPHFKESGKGRWITLVVNNIDDKGHPFHMHGYSFYVVARQQAAIGKAYGLNPHDKSAMADVDVNTANPLRKDTVYIPSMGYAMLRFELDNDGLWLLHCHVLWHHAIGMGIVIQVGEDASAEVRRRAAQQC